MNMRSDHKIKLSKKTNNILEDILLKASNFTTKKEERLKRPYYTRSKNPFSH